MFSDPLREPWLFSLSLLSGENHSAMTQVNMH
jgi:hypothetical protein